VWRTLLVLRPRNAAEAARAGQEADAALAVCGAATPAGLVGAEPPAGADDADPQAATSARQGTAINRFKRAPGMGDV
jgi:hypothetical protein